MARNRTKKDCFGLWFTALSAPSMQQVNVGMIGGGTVGSGVYNALRLNASLMNSRLGMSIRLRKIAVKAYDEPRPYEIPRPLMTTDWQSVVNDPEIQVIIEVMGGTTLAKSIILAALKLGKPVSPPIKRSSLLMARNSSPPHASPALIFISK